MEGNWLLAPPQDVLGLISKYYNHQHFCWTISFKDAPPMLRGGPRFYFFVTLWFDGIWSQSVTHRSIFATWNMKKLKSMLASGSLDTLWAAGIEAGLCPERFLKISDHCIRMFSHDNTNGHPLFDIKITSSHPQYAHLKRDIYEALEALPDNC